MAGGTRRSGGRFSGFHPPPTPPEPFGRTLRGVYGPDTVMTGRRRTVRPATVSGPFCLERRCGHEHSTNHFRRDGRGSNGPGDRPRNHEEALMPKHCEHFSPCCKAPAPRYGGSGSRTKYYYCKKCRGKFKIVEGDQGFKVSFVQEAHLATRPFPSPCCKARSPVRHSHTFNGTTVRHRRCTVCDRSFITHQPLIKKGKNNGQSTRPVRLREDLKAGRQSHVLRTPKRAVKGADNRLAGGRADSEHLIRFCKPYQRRGACPNRPPSQRARDNATHKELRAAHRSHDLPPAPDSVLGTAGNGERGAMGQVERVRKCIECGGKMKFGNSPVCQDCSNPRTEFEYGALPTPLARLIEETFS